MSPTCKLLFPIQLQRKAASCYQNPSTKLTFVLSLVAGDKRTQVMKLLHSSCPSLVEYCSPRCNIYSLLMPLHVTTSARFQRWVSTLTRISCILTSIPHSPPKKRSSPIQSGKIFSGTASVASLYSQTKCIWFKIMWITRGVHCKFHMCQDYTQELCTSET